MGDNYSIRDSLTFDLELNITKSTYDADSDGFVQEDTSLTLSANITWSLTDSMSLYLKDSYIKNDSNLDDDDDDNNYTQNTLSVGVSLYL